MFNPVAVQLLPVIVVVHLKFALLYIHGASDACLQTLLFPDATALSSTHFGGFESIEKLMQVYPLNSTRQFATFEHRPRLTFPPGQVVKLPGGLLVQVPEDHVHSLIVSMHPS